MADIGRIVNKSSTAFKIALLGLILTLILHIVGYSTNSWTVIKDGRGSVKHGLWKICVCIKGYFSSDPCLCYDFPSGMGWNLDTVRAFESLGLIGILMTLVFSIVGVVHDNGGTWKVMSLISAFASGLVILIGIIIYAATIAFGAFLHYSFALCTLSGCVILVCACLLIADKNTRPRPGPGGGAVLHYNNQAQVAVVQPGYTNQGQYVGPSFQAGPQPPPYSQVQYYSGHSVTTVMHGQAPPAPAYTPSAPMEPHAAAHPK